MRGGLSFFWFAVKEPGKALKIARLAREFRQLALYRIVDTLEHQLSRPWMSWPDKEFAFLLYQALVDEGVAEWRSDASLELVRRPEHPGKLSPEIADFAVVVERAVNMLPELLEGKRRFFTEKDLLLLYAKFLDNLGYNWFRRAALGTVLPRELRTRRDAVIVDVGAGIGLSTLALLELTRGTIVTVDPFEENLEIARDYATIHRVHHRLRTLRGYAEDFRLENPADAAVLFNVLHWCNNPRLAIRNSAGNVKSGGHIIIVQGVRDEKTAKLGAVITYALGSRLAPSRSELLAMVKEEGLSIQKHYASPISDMLLARVP